MNEWIYPELKYLPRWIDRQAAMLAFQPRILRNWAAWVIFTLAVAFGASMPWVIQTLNRSLPGSLHLGGAIMQGLIAGALQGITFGLAFNFVFRKPGRRFLREYLNERGHNLCLECGYDLRGQTTPRCPECGTAFDPARLQSDTERRD